MQNVEPDKRVVMIQPMGLPTYKPGMKIRNIKKVTAHILGEKSVPDMAVSINPLEAKIA